MAISFKIEVMQFGSDIPMLITAWYGPFNIGIADEIERDLNSGEWDGLEAIGTYYFDVHREQEQRSFPEYIDFPAYWDLSQTKFEPMPKDGAR